MTTEGKPIRIGTWNVEYAHNVRNLDRLKLLMSHDADVWVLTETHGSLDLSETHTAYRSNARPIVSNVDADSTWVTIWSKFPLCKRIDVPDSRRQVAALFDTPAGRLAVAGVVLPWHCDRGDVPVEPSPANWFEHRRVLKNEIPTLIANLSAESDWHRVIAGDFNTDLSPPYTKYSYGPGIESRGDWHKLLEQEKLVCHTMHLPYPDPPPPRVNMT